ncbi:hypothetical protein Hanom_Chr06g00555541 [Helianthus anomalus]
MIICRFYSFKHVHPSFSQSMNLLRFLFEEFPSRKQSVNFCFKFKAFALCMLLLTSCSTLLLISPRVTIPVSSLFKPTPVFQISHMYVLLKN